MASEVRSSEMILTEAEQELECAGATVSDNRPGRPLNDGTH
jgi:hypothetical protein